MKPHKRPVIVGHGVEFRFRDGFQIFSHLEFLLSEGRHALIGAEDVGKSTLARLIAGELVPSAGSITRHVPLTDILLVGPERERTPEWRIMDELGVAREVEAHRKVAAGATDLDLIAIASEAWDIEERCMAALAAEDLPERDLERPLAELSPLSRWKVELARRHLTEPVVLICDEPFVPEDEAAQAEAHLLKLLGEFQGTILLVTKQLSLLQAVDSILELSDEGLRFYPGNFDDYSDFKAEEMRVALDRLAHAKAELARRRDFAEDAEMKQISRIERARRLADSGIPKVHRGNRKRQSQETLSKVKSVHERRVHEAEEKVNEALRRQEQAQLPDFASSSTEDSHC